ncbi:hypothetical protein L1987_52545 [Smallanthus sonchifolius]|uniref:Uncharacterized protein n=1 Tax=Smallanthus sonchifolius TaxID=185202 RepID=A0ACB9ETF5_9ASTR|nr:hypothetical protein L1987_52545 [Smallanthus sonchifolius]
MLAFDDIHCNYNMSSQLKFHSIKKQPDFTFVTSPKQNNHQEHYEIWSKNIPSKTMVEGRKELMDMMNDLPESWFELSLKDMVEKDPDDLGLVIGDKVDMKPELKGKKKGAKRGPISRSVSLDTGVFLLKMFVPNSFGSKKHPVSRSVSIGGLKKRHVDVKQSKTWRFVENRSNISSRSYNDTRCCTSAATKNRYAEGTLKPGCWFKSTNQKWCIFF